MSWNASRSFSREVFEKVFAPMGLEIGAESPEEIAVSVVAEMIAARRMPDSDWRALSKSIFASERLKALLEVIGCVLLAAGASRRMGTPKALLDYRGETFLDRLIRITGAVCDPVIVVLGHHAEAIRAGVRGKATFVVNPEPERGQLSSLQTGVAAFLQTVPPADGEGFAFMPMDCPAVEGVDGGDAGWRRRFRNRGPETLLVIPRRGDKRGHPVLGTRQIAEELMALPLDTGAARDAWCTHMWIGRSMWMLTTRASSTDVDDPAAYKRLLETAL